MSGADTGAFVEVGREALTLGSAEGNVLRLKDAAVSRFHAELSQAGPRILVRDLGSTNGTHVGSVLFRDGEVAVKPGSEVVVGETSLRVNHQAVVMLPRPREGSHLGLIGPSLRMRELSSQIERLAASNVPTLVLGESGTGKERVARALHEAGPRRDNVFEIVECGALSPQLVASELFGHEAGAFTGARKTHIGAIERANGGTLFLDEIGELPAEQQVALLGALERGTVRRVGGSRPVPVDVRLVSATHRDLRGDVNAGTFRLDLYFRLAVVMLRVPPLRERAGDIPALLDHFLREEGFSGDPSEVFPGEAMKQLLAHRWVGNVRELRNVVRAALALGEPPALLDFEGTHGDRVFSELLDHPFRAARTELNAYFERRYVESLLTRAGQNLKKAAEMASMDRSHLTSLAKKHGLR